MVSYAQAAQVEGFRYLMLVPKGAPQPKVFQRKYPLDYLMYTHREGDFYPVLNGSAARH